jgi:hypothetical protein
LGLEEITGVKSGVTLQKRKVPVLRLQDQNGDRELPKNRNDKQALPRSFTSP